jgi:hypothetical protein
MRETGMQGAVSYKRCSKIRVAFNVEMRYCSAALLLLAYEATLS